MLFRSHCAQPYTWPLAHNVRPAAQSLGVRGCEDCHSTDSPFYFSEVGVASPVASLKNATTTMADFQDTGTFYQSAFALTFLFRPWLKAVIALSALLVLAVVAIYSFQGLAGLLKSLAED